MSEIPTNEESSEEIWADVPGFEEYYQASTRGRIRSKPRFVRFKDNRPPRWKPEVILTGRVDKWGYVRVCTSVNGISRTWKVHRVIALTFIPNSNNKPQVNHKDGNKQNNHSVNLEWMTNAENQIHALESGLARVNFGELAPAFTGSVLVFKDGVQIDTLYGNQDMAEKGYDFRLVSACIMRKRKTHRNCTFTKQTT